MPASLDLAFQRSQLGPHSLRVGDSLELEPRAFAERQAGEDRLRRFLADASHELRTPLASIRGYAELFRMGAAHDPDDTEKAMTRIESEAARMGVLVEDLLTLARLDEVRDDVRTDADVSRLAGDVVDDARSTAPDRCINLTAEPHSVVSGDPHRLRQVLANLLHNALVHSPPGTPVEVHVARPADTVLLQVRDHGPGLRVDDADVLFERFWRTEGGRERGRAGAGLGLAIVAGIVGAHGGEVHADNAPGGGARFTVRLPAKPRVAPPVLPARQPPADARGRVDYAFELRLSADRHSARASALLKIHKVHPLARGRRLRTSSGHRHVPRRARGRLLGRVAQTARARRSSSEHASTVRRSSACGTWG